MKNHNGMRPQDVVILLKVFTLNGVDWKSQDVAESLQISPAEVSESLNRSRLARLISEDKRIIFSESFLEFLIYGVKYVFPAISGAIVRGVPTAHSAPPLKSVIVAEKDHYVWKSSAGTMRGQAITPLYKTLPKIAPKDERLYELLALVDTIRVGKTREVKLAVEELTKRLKAN